MFKKAHKKLNNNNYEYIVFSRKNSQLEHYENKKSPPPLSWGIF